MSFQIPEAPMKADIARCVHCGLCLNHCPTYRLTGLETESPRGRLFLIRQLAEDKQAISVQFLRHIALCLDCRNCETVCPSGVRFGHLLEAARGEIVARGRLGRFERAVRWLVLKKIWPHPARVNAIVALLAVYQQIGLQRLLRALGLFKHLGRLGEMEALLPATRKLNAFRKPHPYPSPSPFQGAGRGEGRRAALFTGCIMRAGFAGLHHATIRVLERNGWHVDMHNAQICCGALHVHAGEREIAKEMARKNIDALTPNPPSPYQGEGQGGGYDALIVNAAGCGAALKEYGELLCDDPVYAQRAQEFSAHVMDISEALAQSPLREPTRALKLRVTYQEACHLVHAQRIKKQPRDVLRQIPGVELVEMKASDRCCGSAGIYNVLHPEIANQLIDEKMANIAATGAEVVVTANIGCLLQLEYGKARAAWTGRVAHLVELLDEAYFIF